MDPISALALACNVLDIVGTAIKCGLAVKQVYDSKDGLQRVHLVAETQANRMEEVVAFLRAMQVQIEASTDDKEIHKIAARCMVASQDLQRVLGDCRAKHKSFFSASKATVKARLNRDKVTALQEELKACQQDLQSFIGIATRGDVAKILRILDGAGIENNTEIATKLSNMEDRLKLAIIGSSDEDQSLQEAMGLITDGLIIEALHSEILSKRFEDLAREHSGTFDWIFSDPEMVRRKEPRLEITFPDWLKSGSGVFHISGKPGSGKSTLMKYLCGRGETKTLLEAWAGDVDRKLVTAKFFFWRIGSSHEQKSLIGLMRGLLYEIICQVPALARNLFPDQWQRASQNSRGLRKIQVTPDEIVTAFTRLVEGSASPDHTRLLGRIRVCFFIDGLDEFQDASSGLVKTHGRLAEMLQFWAAESQGNVKFCVSSRIEAPFTSNFPVQQRLTLNNLTLEDIRRVVRSELGEHKNFKLLKEKKGNKCEDLLETIITASNGVFLWVALLVKDLCQGLENGDPIDVLKERVEQAPQELDDFLDQIINRIQPVYRKGAYLLLAVILRTTGSVLSTEPRSMDYALYDEMDFSDEIDASDFNFTTLGCFSILRAADKKIDMVANVRLGDLDFLGDPSPSDADRNDWSATIMARCNGLLEVVDGGYVKFMHRSIPEFLQKHFRCHHRAHGLDDHIVTVAMAWTYLIELRHSATVRPTTRAAQEPMIVNPFPVATMSLRRFWRITRATTRISRLTPRAPLLLLILHYFSALSSVELDRSILRNAANRSSAYC